MGWVAVAEFTPPVALVETLMLAVPMWQMKLRELYGNRIVEAAVEQSRGDAIAQIVAAHGDDLMFGGPELRNAFNAVAEGLAIASLVPGGITIFGYHWHGQTIRRVRDDAPPWLGCSTCTTEMGVVV